MKILVLSDCESKKLYDYYKPEYLEGIDLIISCGDLPAGYPDHFLRRPARRISVLFCHHVPRTGSLRLWKP